MDFRVSITCVVPGDDRHFMVGLNAGKVQDLLFPESDSEVSREDRILLGLLYGYEECSPGHAFAFQHNGRWIRPTIPTRFQTNQFPVFATGCLQNTMSKSS